MADINLGLDSNSISKQELSITPDMVKKTEVEASAVLIGGTQEIDVDDVDLRQIEKLLYLHPILPRGIEIKANRIVGRGFKINGPNQEANDYCKAILENSGDVTFLKRWIEDTYAFGNGYCELIPSADGKEILLATAVHPVYFGYAKEDVTPKNRPDIETSGSDRLYIIYDSKTQKPKGFQQYRYINDKLEPFGKILPLDKIAHLAFDKWGDEVEGISVIKYVINILNYVLNIESAGAEAGYRTVNPRYKFTTTINNQTDLTAFATSVANINEKDSIILTEGTDVDILSGGVSDFMNYHDKFISLLSVRLGIPKPLLLLDGTSTNKSTLREQTDFMRIDNQADEKIIEQTIKRQIFEPACKLKFGENFGQENPEDIPTFEFNEYVDSYDVIIDRLKESSLAIVNLTNSALQLLKNGMKEEAKNILSMIPKEENYDEDKANTEYEEINIEERATKVGNQVDVATNQNPAANNAEDTEQDQNPFNTNLEK